MDKNDEKKVDNIDILINFTLQKEENLPENIIKNVNSTYKYTFLYNGKKYDFSLFSNRQLQEYDFKNLYDKEKREKNGVVRTVKLACSMDLVNPKVIVVKNACNELFTVICFQEKNEERIMDYNNNLIMNKDDYFELFQIECVNVLKKIDMYYINGFMRQINSYTMLHHFLICSKERLEDLGKHFPLLKSEFDEDGKNMKNYMLFADNLFFMKPIDYDNREYSKTRKELNYFTLHPEENNKNIYFNETISKYVFTNEEFGDFEFGLLSDYIVDEEQKQILLSDKRYKKCHINSKNILYSLNELDRKSAYVVGGKIRANELDYFYHSWVEILDKNIVLDFNHNLVMNKDEYYKLYGAIAINKTSFLEYNENIDVLINTVGFDFSPQFLNYFGNDLKEDIKRNHCLFKAYH